MAEHVEISREDIEHAENLIDKAKPPIKALSEEAAPRSPAEPLADHQIKKPISDDVVIAFVKELDIAQQHFELAQEILRIMKDRIPARPRRFAFYLDTINQEHHIFPLLCLSDFYHYIKAYFVASNEYSDPIHIQAALQKKEAYICSGPAFDLLFEARHHGYILDKDPRVELQKLEEYTPHIYDSLICQEPPVDRQARTVTVSNLSDEVLGEDIWDFFSSCGQAEHVEMKSVSDGQIAEITFKDTRSAYFAAGCTIYTEVYSEFQQHEDVPLLVKLNTAADVVGKDEDIAANFIEKFEELSNIYTETMKNYKGIHANSVEKAEEPSNMYTEAMKIYKGIQVLYGDAPVQ